MKLIFSICFFLQGSSWKVKEVHKSNEIYEVQIYKKQTIDSTSGILYKIYYTDMVKCPEKL